jgi:radical SAM protein with 4Fe4S-binding SPASM domain
MNKKSAIKSLMTIPRSIYHYKKGSLTLPYLPNIAWIEPTNVCNLKCIMCPNSVITQKNPGFMNMDLYKKIIDEGKNHFSGIILCLAGEPFLHQQLPEMVKYAKQNGIGVMLSTNGTVMTSDTSRKIIKAGIDWINFSFDGCSKEIYEKIRVGGDFEKTIENIADFLEIKKELKSKVKAEIQILIMDENGQKDFDKNISAFKKRFDELSLDNIQFRKPSTWGGVLHGTDKYEYKELGKTYSPCSYLWSSMHFLWDGTVVACTTDFWGKNSLGKFPNQSIRQIWNGKKFQIFRKAMLERKYQSHFEYCDKCDSLWSERIIGLPSGIRGVSGLTFAGVFGYESITILKKIAEKISSKFVMRSFK